MAEIIGNPFDTHTKVVEEVLQKSFHILADLDLMRRPTGERPNLPKSQIALLQAIAGCKALSASTRKVLRDGLAEIPRIHAARAAQSPEEARVASICLSIIYGSQSREDLEKGLNLIEESFPEKRALDEVQAAREMIKSGEGRIYATGSEQELDLHNAGSLPKASYSAKALWKVDLAAAVGAFLGGIKNPQLIAAAAAGASAVAAVEDVLDWAFPEEVPLFPTDNGPYNPYPS